MPKEQVPPHPRREPEITGPLTLQTLQKALGNSVDFCFRTLFLAGQREKPVIFCVIQGLSGGEAVQNGVLRVLNQWETFANLSLEGCFARLREGGICVAEVAEVTELAPAVNALLEGNVLLLFPNRRALACAVGGEEKRSIAEPAEEPDAKGAKDGFVESLRTNTGLLRRRLRCKAFRVSEAVVGRQGRTRVDVVYLENIAHPAAVAEVKRRLAALDIDALPDAGHVEQYLCDTLLTPFPQLLSTPRPDRTCAELLRGRVAVLVDGLPLAFLLPATAQLFLTSPQDATRPWVAALALTALRHLSLFLTLFLPAFYVAAVLFHPEMLPLALAESIIAARENVPFGTLFEAVLLLLAFEVLQEAGLRLPGNLGQSVGILGGLVVGSAAVEAKILSPAVLIVVAAAGVAGYTIPSQDFAAAARLWRLVLTLCAGVAGLLGVSLGAAVLVGHLAGLTDFGVPYLALQGQNAATGVPFPRFPLRPKLLKSRNRRRQG